VMMMLGVGLRAMARDIRYGIVNKLEAQRWLKWMYLVPSAFLIGVACEYQLQAWRFLSIETGFVGWLAIGTIAMAAWTQLQLRSSPEAQTRQPI